MDFNKLKQLSKDNENLFVSQFGFFLMKVSRKDLPQLIEIGLQTKNEIVYRKILNSIPFLLKKVKISELGTLVNILFEDPSCYKLICNNFKKLSEYFAPNNIEKVIQAFLKIDANSKIIANNLETFLENSKNKVQSKRIIETIKHIPNCNAKINQYESVLLNLGDFHFLESLNVGTMMKLINSNSLDDIKNIFTKYSDGNLKSVHYLANGFTSTVFAVNDKIIKIGRQRIKFNSQFSKYLLQPYLRKEFLDFDGNVLLTIEIQDRCSSTINADPKKLEDFVEILKQHSNEFIWDDANIQENLFVLEKDNNRKIPPNEDGFCYDGVQDINPVGKKGDFVIGDTDFVFSPEEYEKRQDSYRTPPYKKTFSLILPTYNMEKHLRNCLNSILNQNCDDYEVIIINDGSSDNSLKIAEEYASIDSRFKIFSFENGGLSTARNRGIARAQGEYIILIDPDDTIEPELLDKLKSYVEKGIETIRFGAIVQNDNPKKNKYRFNRPYYPEIISGIDALKMWNYDKRYATVWLYCINKKVYERCNFKFPNVKIYEDVASIPKLIANSKTVAMLDYIGYNYVQHEHTLTNGTSNQKLLDNLHGFITAYDCIKDIFDDFFLNHHYDDETKSLLLKGFFLRLENKFKHTNLYEKDKFAYELFIRHKDFMINYNPEQYFNEASTGINQNHFYIPEKLVRTLEYDNTNISKLGTYTYNINGYINNLELYKVEKDGQYNFSEKFLCMSNIDFDKLNSDPHYREAVFTYLLSYSNMFLAEALNGSYIRIIKN